MKWKKCVTPIFCLLIAPALANAHTVVLDTFDVDPYVNTHGGNCTGVYYPSGAQPAAWPWGYVGYGDTTCPPGSADDSPVIGSRDTGVKSEGAASWKFELEQGANLSPYTGVDPYLENEGPIIQTVLNHTGLPESDTRTLDEVIAGLGKPPIDWYQPVKFLVDVWGSCEAEWEGWRQGIFVFGHPDSSKVDVQYTCAQDQQQWNTASLQMQGPDNGGYLAIGIFGALDWNPPDGIGSKTSGAGEILSRNGGEGNPPATMRFDNFRIEYTPTTGDYGDAPEDAVAYPDMVSNSISRGATMGMGLFPTCRDETGGYIVHRDLTYLSTKTNGGAMGAYFGSGLDFETDGNGGSCCFPPYDQDECFDDGDAGLIKPGPYTLTAPAPPVTDPDTVTAYPADPVSVTTCPGSDGYPLGAACQTVAWGRDIDIYVNIPDIVNGDALRTPAVDRWYVNVIIDWNRDGEWGGASDCSETGDAEEHVLKDYQIEAPYTGPLSGAEAAGKAQTLPPLLVGPVPGRVWVRFTITSEPILTINGISAEARGGEPVPDPWDGSGDFNGGESEDYLLLVVETSSIGDTIFYDRNKNGVQDSGEEGIEGVTVNVYEEDEAENSSIDNAFAGGVRASFPGYTFLATQNTDGNGKYLFTGLSSTRRYIIWVDESTLPRYVVPTAGKNPTDPIRPETGEEYNMADFGYGPPYIPTLNQWGMIFLTALLAAAASWFIRRRKRTV